MCSQMPRTTHATELRWIDETPNIFLDAVAQMPSPTYHEDTVNLNGPVRSRWIVTSTVRCEEALNPTPSNHFSAIEFGMFTQKSEIQNQSESAVYFKTSRTGDRNHLSTCKSVFGGRQGGFENDLYRAHTFTSSCPNSTALPISSRHAHSRGEWGLCWPVERLGVGSPISVS